DGCEQLRIRSDRAHGTRREWQFLLIVAIAVAFREDELVVHHNADAHAGRVPVLQGLRHVGVESLQLFRDIDTLCRGVAYQGEEHETGSGWAPRHCNRSVFHPSVPIDSAMLTGFSKRAKVVSPVVPP